LQSIILRKLKLAIVFVSIIAGGCQTAFIGQAPAGPGAATESDLTPWLATATNIRRFGCLEEINVPGQQGSYETWALETPVAAQSVEIDVRACAGAAEDFRGKNVIIEGKLIERGDRHLPLIVAGRMIPADENGNPLPDPVNHAARTPQPDPVTNEREPLAAFRSSDFVAAAQP